MQNIETEYIQCANTNSIKEPNHTSDSTVTANRLGVYEFSAEKKTSVY